MIIGGAEDKIRDRVILNRFTTLAGGSDGVVVVISTASSLGHLAGERYREVFAGLGIGTVRPLHAMTRAQANDETFARQLRDATGIFLTGGNQLRLSSTIGGTLLAEAVLERFRAGAVVAGTSAGASAMSSHMIAFGASGGTPKHRMAALAAGLGVLPSVIVDQHFQQRNRYGRLLSVIAQNPSLLGLGVDEDTAGVVGPDHVMEVIGRGQHHDRRRRRRRDRRLGREGPPAGHDQRRRPARAAGRLPVRPSAPPPDRRCRHSRPSKAARSPRPEPPRWSADRLGCAPGGSSASSGQGRADWRRPRRETSPDTKAVIAEAKAKAGPTARRAKRDRRGKRPARRAGPARRPSGSSTPGCCAGRTTGRRSRSSRCSWTSASLEQFPTTKIPGFVDGLARLDAVPRGPRLLPEPARRLRHPAQGRDVDGPRRRAHRARAAEPRRHRRAPRQDALRRRRGPVQRHLRVPRGGGRARGRQARRPDRQPPRRAGRSRSRRSTTSRSSRRSSSSPSARRSGRRPRRSSTRRPRATSRSCASTAPRSSSSARASTSSASGRR